MFDTDYKKGLRRKYGRMQAATVGPQLGASAATKGMTTSVMGGGQSTSAGDMMGLGTVLGDLKLTEHLSN